MGDWTRSEGHGSLVGGGLGLERECYVVFWRDGDGDMGEEQIGLSLG